MLPKIDLRILRTRRSIIDAFKQLMQEMAISDMTVKDIAERAMINRATFYAHFVDKYDLFETLIRETFLSYLADKFPTAAPLDLQHVEMLATAVFDYMGTLNNRCHKPTREQFRPLVESQVQAQLYEVICQWLAEANGPVSDDETVILSSLMSWSIFGAGLQWNRADSPVSKQMVIDEVTKFIGHSLEEHLGVKAV